MTSFLLRDIPKPLHAKLKQLAKRQRRTMRQMMFVVLEEAVASEGERPGKDKRVGK